ncbi:MAG: hypothetical protein ABSA79_02615 [Candidatus Bathyarchaeia archaeon]|jgi:hypothetical protein
MVTIAPNELKSIGTGKLYSNNKLYIPASVVDHLELGVNQDIEYFQILDPNYQDYIVIKKKRV